MRLGCRARPRLVDMQRDGIDQVHGVTARSKPGRVLARPSADVQHDRWRRRQVPQEQLFGPAALELAFLSLEPLVLLAAYSGSNSEWLELFECWFEPGTREAERAQTCRPSNRMRSPVSVEL